MSRHEYKKEHYDRMEFYTSEEQKERLKIIAEEKGVSINGLLSTYIEKLVKENETEE